MADRFAIRNLDTGEVYPADTFAGFEPPPEDVPSMASETESKEFRKLFGTFRKEESLHYAFSCHLWESITAFQSRRAKKRHQGIMYISSNHLSFAEQNAQRKPVKIGIPLSEVVDLLSQDFGLSEGIVVSTRRETKFYFEQFSSRNEALIALNKVWTFSQVSASTTPVANLFDPLAGISASTTLSAPRVEQQRPFSDTTMTNPLDTQSNASRQVRTQPVPARVPPPPPQQTRTRESTPTSQSKQNITPSSTSSSRLNSSAYAAVSRQNSAKSVQRPKSKESVDSQFMDIHPTDDWFMTLTKIYYRLGKGCPPTVITSLTNEAAVAPS